MVPSDSKGVSSIPRTKQKKEKKSLQKLQVFNSHGWVQRVTTSDVVMSAVVFGCGPSVHQGQGPVFFGMFPMPP
jgi:hypothetical protein